MSGSLRTERRIHSLPDRENSVIRTAEAAYHVAEMRGVDATRVLAEWVIERESLFHDIAATAAPIIHAVHGLEEGGAFDTASVGGIKRRWLFRLRHVIADGKKMSDWRLAAQRPLTLVQPEREELDRARSVIAAVHRWLHTDERHAMTLADYERDIAVAMREYDPRTSDPTWRMNTADPQEGA